MASNQYPDKPTINSLGEFRAIICIPSHWDDAQALEFLEQALHNLGRHPVKPEQLSSERCEAYPLFKHVTFIL